MALEAKENRKNNIIDWAHATIAQSWDNANNGLDTFFANTKFTEEESEGFVKLSFSRRIQEHGDAIQSIDFRIKTSFPQTTRKLKFVIKDDTPESELNSVANFHNDQKVTEVDSATNASNYSAILQYEFIKKDRWKVTTDQGVRLDLPLNPFFKIRFRYKKAPQDPMKNFTFFFIQQFRYYYQERTSTISEVQLYRQLNLNFSVTFSTGITWEERNNAITLHHGIALHQKINDKTAMNYILSTSADIKTIEYKYLHPEINITRLLYRRWFYGTISVGSDLAINNNLKSNNYAYFSVTIIF